MSNFGRFLESKWGRASLTSIISWTLRLMPRYYYYYSINISLYQPASPSPRYRPIRQKMTTKAWVAKCRLPCSINHRITDVRSPIKKNQNIFLNKYSVCSYCGEPGGTPSSCPSSPSSSSFGFAADHPRSPPPTTADFCEFFKVVIFI